MYTNARSVSRLNTIFKQRQHERKTERDTQRPRYRQTDRQNYSVHLWKGQYFRFIIRQERERERERETDCQISCFGYQQFGNTINICSLACVLHFTEQPKGSLPVGAVIGIILAVLVIGVSVALVIFVSIQAFSYTRYSS